MIRNMNEYWWTSNIAIPSDIVLAWGLQLSSGQSQLTLQNAFNGRDISFDICGE